MKILIATGIYPPDVGGPATYSKYITEELPKRGHEVHVEVYARVREYFPRVISHIVYAFKVWRLARKMDVILTTDTISAGLPVHLASFLSGRPYVLKIGGDYVWEQAVQRWGVRNLLDEFLKKKYGWKIQLMRKLQSHVAKRASRVITPSKYLAGVAEQWGVRKEKISVIYNAIHVSKITFAKPNKPILFSFGRDVPWKGFSMLREITKEFPHVTFKIGEVSREERDLWFGKCDIFLF
ncbi:MAG: glycosyltransferase family 4 protein, partial [bacterium]|nr:glycosyltransferase family 4 protein [bacterium]